jgi:hypothetical protein
VYFYFYFFVKLRARVTWLQSHEEQHSVNTGAATASEAPSSRWTTTALDAESAATNVGLSSLSAHTQLPDTLEALYADFMVEDLMPVAESQDVTGLFARIPVHVRPTMELAKSFAWLRGSTYEVFCVNFLTFKMYIYNHSLVRRRKSSRRASLSRHSTHFCWRTR